MKTWIGLAVAVGLAIGWAICRFNGDVTHRREHFQELASSSGALGEWKGIWNAGNPMPPLVKEPVGEKSALIDQPAVPILQQVSGTSKPQNSTDARLERVLEKLEQIERLLSKLDKTASDNNDTAPGGMTLPQRFYLDHPPAYIPPSHIPHAVGSIDNSSRTMLEIIGASLGNPWHWLLQIWANQCEAQQNIRIMQLIDQSEFTDHPSQLAPKRIDGGLQ